MFLELLSAVSAGVGIVNSIANMFDSNKLNKINDALEKNGIKQYKVDLNTAISQIDVGIKTGTENADMMAGALSLLNQGGEQGIFQSVLDNGGSLTGATQDFLAGGNVDANNQAIQFYQELVGSYTGQMTAVNAMDQEVRDGSVASNESAMAEVAFSNNVAVTASTLAATKEALKNLTDARALYQAALDSLNAPPAAPPDTSTGSDPSGESHYLDGYNDYVPPASDSPGAESDAPSMEWDQSLNDGEGGYRTVSQENGLTWDQSQNDGEGGYVADTKAPEPKPDPVDPTLAEGYTRNADGSASKTDEKGVTTTYEKGGGYYDINTGKFVKPAGDAPDKPKNGDKVDGGYYFEGKVVTSVAGLHDAKKKLKEDKEERAADRKAKAEAEAKKTPEDKYAEWLDSHPGADNEDKKKARKRFGV
jgi:hypothetical protein